MAHCTTSVVTLQTNDPSREHLTDHVEHLTDHVEHLTDHVEHLTDHVEHLTDHVEHLTDHVEHLTDHVEHLTDCELLSSTQRLVARSNQVFAALLAHLAEVEARGVHRMRACASLYTYCIYVLRFSEDAAFRRVAAARLVKRFPALLGAIQRGELHLTGLLMIGPHLTLENHLEVLARAKHRTKKEIARLVRVLSPLPSVPARIEPLGPAPARRATLNPSWEMMLELPVRHLPPRERPADWIVGDPTHNDGPTHRDGPNYAGGLTGDDGPTGVDGSTHENGLTHQDGPMLGRDGKSRGEGALAGGVGPALARRECDGEDRKPSEDRVGPALARRECDGEDRKPSEDGVGPALARRECDGEDRKPSEDGVGAPALATEAREALLRESELLGSGGLERPERYLVQFTTTEEYVRLCEEAKGLLSHTPGARTIEAIHLRAMRALVAALKKRKYAVSPGAQPGAGEGHAGAHALRPHSDTSAELQKTEEDGKGQELQKTEGNREGQELQKTEGNREGQELQKTEGNREGQELQKTEGNREGQELQGTRDNLEGLDNQPFAPTGGPCGASGGADTEDGEVTGVSGRRPYRGRYLKAAVRREVFERDEGCCTYLDEFGRRCRETSRLEFHHARPFARGGQDDVSNLTLRCREHNHLAAEQDFGRAFMARQRDTLEHESYAREREAASDGFPS